MDNNQLVNTPVLRLSSNNAFINYFLVFGLFMGIFQFFGIGLIGMLLGTLVIICMFIFQIKFRPGTIFYYLDYCLTPNQLCGNKIEDDEG